MTETTELPEVEGDEDDLDGCDVDFNEMDATPDEELPPAEGGVA